MEREYQEDCSNIVNGDDQLFTSQDLTQNLIQSYQNKKMCRKNAVVFAGNSRMGKTTLLAVLSHIELLIVRKQGDQDLKIQPKQSRLRNNKNFIQHNKCSVTQFPNIRNIMMGNQQISAIDLPGFKDSSYFRELCNWHHTLEIIGHLQKALFVMVVEVYPDSKVIKSSELDMMLRFQEAFYQQGQIAGDNIIFVVNFVSGIQNAVYYNKVKKEIVANTLKKLQMQYKDKTKYKGLRDFYAKSFTIERVLLIQKVERKDQTDNQLKVGVQYKNESLENFVKDHLQRMKKPNSSTYKLKFTLQNNPKSKALRRLLFQFVKQTRQSIEKMFDILKQQISQLIKSYNKNKMSKFTLKDYNLLQKFIHQDIYRYKNAINQDQFHQTGHTIRETIEELVCDVGYWFDSISKQNLKKQQQKIYVQSLNRNQANLQQRQIKRLNRFKLIKTKFQQLLKLCQNIFTKHFTFQSRSEAQKINRFLSSSFNIQISSLLFVAQNVQDFRVFYNNDEDQLTIEKTQNIQMFLSQLSVQLFQIIDEIAKFKYDFKDEIPKVFDNSITEMANTQPKYISIDFLNKLKDSCFLLNRGDLQQRSVKLLYSSCHRILPLVIYELHIKFEQSLKLLKKIYDTLSSLTAKELDLTIQYKKSADWANIKSAAYIQLIRYLVQAGYHQQKLCQYYMLLNDYHEQLFQIISKINHSPKQAKSELKQELKQGTRYSIFMEVGQYFIENLQFQFAQSCFNYASHIHSINSDERKQAKYKIIQLWKLNRQQIYQKFQQNWKVIIPDQKYMEVIKRVMQESGKIKKEVITKLEFINNNIKSPSHHSITDSQSPESRKKIPSTPDIKNDFNIPTLNPDDKKIEKKVTRGFVSFN